MTRRPFLVGALLAVVLAATGCSGAPSSTVATAPASANPFQVKIGDCTGELPAVSVSSVSLIPCDQPHYWEAFAASQLTGTTYPGEDAARTAADDFCQPAFTSWIGVSTKKSRYSLMYFYPNDQTWGLSDHQILCLAGSESGPITGTLKDAKK